MDCLIEIKKPSNLIYSDFIHGITNNGNKVSLNTCSECLRDPGPIGKSKFRIILLFIGNHYNCLKEIKINKIIVKYSLLNRWLDIFGLEKKKKVLISLVLNTKLQKL
ncbi:MAG: ApeA N-terminal domain 1-containing protein [bacterium]